MKKERKFPESVARFFNPQKSGANAKIKFGKLLKLGTNQEKKRKEKSCIPVYSEGRTAVRLFNENGEIIYKTINPIR